MGFSASEIQKLTFKVQAANVIDDGGTIFLDEIGGFE